MTDEKKLLLENWRHGDNWECFDGYCDSNFRCGTCRNNQKLVETILILQHAKSSEEQRQRDIDILQTGRNSLKTGIVNETVDFMFQVMQEEIKNQPNS